MDGLVRTLHESLSRTVLRHLVSESFIMLTIETNAEGWQSPCQQVSEKTYKAIKMGMPFINFTSQPGILKHLKYLGFKTFSPIDLRAKS